jgi:peptidyl-prolyl cis-trans isomerase C
MKLETTALAVGLVLALGAAAAADRVLATLPGRDVITTADLAAEIGRLPPPAQAIAGSRPIELVRLTQTIALRRELARRAEAGALDQEPRIAEALRVARERILADAMLDRAEGAPPPAALLESLARNEYDAAPEKFDIPEQVRASHILVSLKACDAEGKARELLARARQPGADFAALARENSDDPGTAARGGDLGFFQRGRMKREFEEAAFALKQPGDLSGVVKTEFGYHIIRLDERKLAKRQSFEAVRDELAKRIAQRELRTRRQLLADQITDTIQFDREAIQEVAAGGGLRPK